MLSRRNRSYPIWTLLALGIIAGIVVTQLQQRGTPTNETAPTVDAPPARVEAESPAQPTLPVEERLPTSVAEPDLPKDMALFVPATGMYMPIVQVYLDGVSWDIRSLGKNAGHLQGTPLPDQGGNVVLSGHVEMADGTAGPFAGLRQAKIGDVVEITMKGQAWRYAISEITTTAPDALEYIFPTQDDRLTLITCGQYDFLSNSYPERLIIVAVRINT